MRCVLLAVALISTGAALAQESGPAPASVPALAPLLKAGVEARLLERLGHLDAWAVLGMGKAGVIYTTTDGLYLVEGSVFAGDDSRNMTLTHQQRAVAMISTAPVTLPPPGPPKVSAAAAQSPDVGKPSERLTTPEGLYQALSEAPGVDFTVPGRPTLIMVVDPSCPHCKAMWGDLRPYLQRREIGVKLVLVASPGTAAEEQAATILYGTNKEVARDEWEQVVNGRPLPILKTDMANEGAAKVAENVALYGNLRLPGTPFAIYRSGTDIRVLAGRPDNISAVVAELKR